MTVFIPTTHPVTRKLQQVCYHQGDIRMRSHRLLQLDDNKSVLAILWLTENMTDVIYLVAEILMVFA